MRIHSDHKPACGHDLAGHLRAAFLGMAVFIAGCGPATEIDVGISGELVRLDVFGNPLAAQATGLDHYCVLDTRTGLMWEVKRAGPGLHHRNHTYTWFSTDQRVHTGEPGQRGGGDCSLERCDTEAFVEAVNSAGLCGHGDWRMPERKELMSLGDPVPGGRGRALDRAYFPNAVDGEFWTASTFGMYSAGAWAVDARHGLDRVDSKSAAKAVRLVRLDDSASEAAR